ncbi:DUF4214 domain-containing protein [Iamia sp.]|uniref:DUF4214 domain-containing protein n=1 Tax=Iamia sp. TaxID=2722710 RepID=UPI002BEDBEC4|nr:DUF4214 domain-containing protein [Iamia sp.]HXH56938.1 DUF4214 domain-containing protein [Iamia sp.]
MSHPAPPRHPRRRSAAVLASAVATVLALVAGGPPAGADPASDAAYADGAHRALVGRDATEDETATWVATLGGGGSRSSLVVPLAGSEELETQLVEAEYLGILGRTPEAEGATFWLDFLQQRGATLRSFEARLLGSPEFQSRAGSTPEDLIDAYYDVVLRRAPSSADTDFWVGELEAGTPPGTVARGFLGSSEARRLDVRLAFDGFLGRTPDAEGLAFWVDVLGATGDEQRFWASLVISREFYDRVQPMPATRARTDGPVAVPVRLLVLG